MGQLREIVTECAGVAECFGDDHSPCFRGRATEYPDDMSLPVSHLDRITIDPQVRFGKPTIRGMRITVQDVLEWLAGGMTFEEILADYPVLRREDLLASLEFAAIQAGDRTQLSLQQ